MSEAKIEKKTPVDNSPQGSTESSPSSTDSEEENTLAPLPTSAGSGPSTTGNKPSPTRSPLSLKKLPSKKSSQDFPEIPLTTTPRTPTYGISTYQTTQDGTGINDGLSFEPLKPDNKPNLPENLTILDGTKPGTPFTHKKSSPSFASKNSKRGRGWKKPAQVKAPPEMQAIFYLSAAANSQKNAIETLFKKAARGKSYPNIKFAVIVGDDEGPFPYLNKRVSEFLNPNTAPTPTTTTTSTTSTTPSAIKIGQGTAPINTQSTIETSKTKQTIHSKLFTNLSNDFKTFFKNHTPRVLAFLGFLTVGMGLLINGFAGASICAITAPIFTFIGFGLCWVAMVVKIDREWRLLKSYNKPADKSATGDINLRQTAVTLIGIIAFLAILALGIAFAAGAPLGPIAPLFNFVNSLFTTLWPEYISAGYITLYTLYSTILLASFSWFAIDTVNAVIPTGKKGEVSVEAEKQTRGDKPGVIEGRTPSQLGNSPVSQAGQEKKQEAEYQPNTPPTQSY